MEIKRLTFPKSKVDNFKHNNPHQTWGRAFYNKMRLHLIDHPQDKAYCERIMAEPDDERAKALVQSKVDKNL